MAKTINSKIAISDYREIGRLLQANRNSYWCRLNGGLIKQLGNDYQRWPKPPVSDLESERARSQTGRIAEHAVAFMRFEIDQIRDQLHELNVRHAEYLKHISRAVSLEQRQKEILDYAKQLGASKRQLKQDRQAFGRWFDHDAMLDRYNKRYAERERYLSFVLDCLGRVAAIGLSADGEIIGYQKLWARFALESQLGPLLSYGGDKRIVTNSFHALSEALKALPKKLQRSSLSEASVRFVYHACLRNSPFTWVQCEALRLLQNAAPNDLYLVIKTRLAHPQGESDLFVRRTVVQILCEQLCEDARLEELLPLALRDPSPAVRQKLAEALATAEAKTIARIYPPLSKDDAREVRASAIHQLALLIGQASHSALAIDFLADSLKNETDTFCLRVGLLSCKQGFEALARSDGAHSVEAFLQRLLPIVEELHQSAPDLSVRRWAAQTREYLLCHKTPEQRARIDELRRFVAGIPPGKTRRLPKSLSLNNRQLGRLLAILAEDDFGFDVEHNRFGRFVTRGHCFGFRFWRFLHEFRHPSSDKRQAFSHTVGRLFWGAHRVPSGILAELAETKVPGEPLYFESEGGWRGYLPLVDEVLSALALGDRTSYFYHSEGVTQLRPPRNALKRWWASWWISWHFAEFAHWRNWQENSQLSPRHYLAKLADLDIEIGIDGHRSETGKISADPAVLRFFPAWVPMADGQTWVQFKQYFVSVYENSLTELAFFMAAAIGLFIGKHIIAYQKIRRARKHIPLVMGGWGTRGKSGSERLKAALINALGHGLVSKTTGCEAMFLQAHPFQPLREILLFRSFDKATIWEQYNVTRLADQFGSEAFLWECMGLNPDYVEILQQQWMQDDISTLTNTYPDHEDIQGPAGINIPQVMTRFIPKRTALITSEEQMRPILQAACQVKNTRFKAVGWLDAGLLPSDMVERFPYDEHPNNIAMVLALADELGVDRDIAIKEMADRVVPDIGVLKIFPPANMRSRRLEFINGMSANERYACLSNWKRCGLDRLSLEAQPDTWLTVVVNNRADRVPRSKVFASILVKDINFDRCVLIGNNLHGLWAYVHDAWLEWIAEINLPDDRQAAESTLLDMAKRLRVPYSEELLKSRCVAMIVKQNADLDRDEIEGWLENETTLEQALLENGISQAQAILAFGRRDRQLFSSYQKWRDTLRSADRITGELQVQFHEQLWRWFEEKLVIVENYHASGAQIIETVCDATPPGFYNRIMGMQNIKGPGLDFVYRWQAWEVCHKACQQLSGSSQTEFSKGLQTLDAFKDFGFLEEDTVRSTIEMAKTRDLGQTELHQAQIHVIANNLEQSLKQLRASGSTSVQSQGKWLDGFINAIEAFLDVGDAVKRRKLADRIYQDLIAQRISYERAVVELQKLNKRQKGRWLFTDTH
ncbi:MAG: HEAT repeat domain-containing protein [Methylococcaceae bacterium]|nr:HEAT repeat domain-containing protein [Methylococcaceae bacterium]